MTKHLISPEIQNAMNIIQWFKTFSIKGLLLTKGINSDVVSDKKQITKYLYKPIIRNFKNRKVYYSFRDNARGTDPPDMQSISKYNKEMGLLLCVINIFSRYACVVYINSGIKPLSLAIF